MAEAITTGGASYVRPELIVAWAKQLHLLGYKYGRMAFTYAPRTVMLTPDRIECAHGARKAAAMIARNAQGATLLSKSALDDASLPDGLIDAMHAFEMVEAIPAVRPDHVYDQLQTLAVADALEVDHEDDLLDKLDELDRMGVDYGRFAWIEFASLEISGISPEGARLLRRNIDGGRQGIPHAPTDHSPIEYAKLPIPNQCRVDFERTADAGLVVD